MKWNVNHDITLNEKGIKPRRGEVVELTKKEVDSIHDKLSKNDKWKHIIPVFERVED